MKKVKIKIESTQDIDGQKDSIISMLEGTLKKTVTGYELYYKENPQSENQSIITRIMIDNDSSVVLNRTGAVSSKMIIKKGEQNDCFYRTPQGDFLLEICGREVSSDINESGGIIKMVYTICSSGSYISDNEVIITVKEV